MRNFRNKNIFIALKNALIGLKYAFLHHRHFKIECLFAILVMILSYFFNLDVFEFLFVILAVFFVLFSEIINTLVEETLDIIEPNYNHQIKILKDISSAMVLIAIIFSIFVGLLIFIRKLLSPIF